MKIIMLLQMDDHKYIADLQDKFNECFPYLYLEFYHTKHTWKQHQQTDSPINLYTLVGSIIKKHKSRLMEIKSWYKAGEVEQIFKKDFGLRVKIFRLQGEHRLQISSNDELTLQQQNDIVKSSLHKYEPPSLNSEEAEPQSEYFEPFKTGLI